MADARTLPLGRLGIIGGGQLARMMIPEAARLGLDTVVLDPTPNSPGGQLAGEQIVGALDDASRLAELVRASTLTTFEIETVDTGGLEALAREGHVIRPAPSLLARIQDKLAQKEQLARAGVPTAEFVAIDTPDARALADFGLPLVQKARRGGYDGRGVAVFKAAVIEEEVLAVPSLAERFVDFRCELAVLVARGLGGEVETYPVVEMVFDDRANVLDLLLAPARIDAAVAERARAVAIAAVEAFDGVGVFGVELFLTRDDEILVNEIAPRPHNSGHWTIEACATSQFEQHVRAVAGLPLGSTRQYCPAVMVNLLGTATARGTPVIVGMEAALALPGVAVHLYGKATVSPFRKMGHVTVTAETMDAALQTAAEARDVLRIEGSDPA
ncbi:MAG: 5-(carboxyamino)imidazole ribonucleotide synthase [Pseudomonadales bacterium]|jgi:5-(carboxyamino)imidazole ribonucleotide synthase|nr:5-(carboxyamino)imidazole ribonucleotide synthase [Pseudomonadales bacterium]